MIHMTHTLTAATYPGAPPVWIAVCNCGWEAGGFNERQSARVEGERHLKETNRTRCANCGHAGGEHAGQAPAPTYARPGQPCQRIECRCTGYQPDSDTGR
jgi:hypothetical protein